MPHTKLATSVALAIGLSATAASSQTDLLFWNQGDASVRDYSQVVIDTFGETHPNVDVTLEIYPNEPYKTAIQVVMGAGSQPDVFFNWAGEDAARFARAKRVLDLTELGEGRWNDVVSPGLLSTYHVESIQAGVPFSQHTSLFYYNTAIFEEHGLTPPSTMDELIGLCGRLREIAPDTIPLALGAREPWTVNHYITMLFTRFVPEEVRAADYSLAAEDDALFTDPRYAEALAQLVALQSEGCFNGGANSVSPEEARSLFAVGAAAMTYCGTWCLGPIDREGLEGGYDVFPMPAVTGADGDQEAIFSVVTGLQISAATASPEEAADFIAHFVGPEMQAEMYRSLQRLPVNAAALEQLDLPPVVARIVQDMSAATSVSMPLDVELEASVSQVVLNIGQELLNGATTPEAAMETIRQAALAASAGN